MFLQNNWKKYRYKVTKERIDRITGKWDMEPGEVTRIHDTVWQVGEHFILKVYENADMPERNLKITTTLDAMNIPVGKVISTKTGKPFAEDEQYYYVLSQKLPGSPAAGLKDNPSIACEMGKMIATLHLAFQKCEERDVFEEGSLLDEMKGWIRESLRESGWKYVEERQFQFTLSQLEALYDKLPVQLIHRDVHLGNFLFDEGRFSGYIDFDLSQRNIRIFDLCYFAVGLLSEKEKLGITAEEWFEVLKSVLAGYQEIIKLSEKEKEAIPYVMQAIELLFAAWYSGQDDGKGAECAMDVYTFIDRNADKIASLKSI